MLESSDAVSFGSILPSSMLHNTSPKNSFRMGLSKSTHQKNMTGREDQKKNLQGNTAERRIPIPSQRSSSTSGRL
ncbi:unnamed protein product [Victoria cruziana]